MRIALRTKESELIEKIARNKFSLNVESSDPYTLVVWGDKENVEAFLEALNEDNLIKFKILPSEDIEI